MNYCVSREKQNAANSGIVPRSEGPKRTPASSPLLRCYCGSAGQTDGQVNGQTSYRRFTPYAVNTVSVITRKVLSILVVISLIGTISRKNIKIVATRCNVLKLKCAKFYFGWGSATDPTGEAYSAPPGPLAGFNAAYF